MKFCVFNRLYFSVQHKKRPYQTAFFYVADNVGLVDGDQFNIKDQCRVRSDQFGSTACTVCQIRWYI